MTLTKNTVRYGAGLFFLSTLAFAGPSAQPDENRKDANQAYDEVFTPPGNAQQREVSAILKDISVASFAACVHAGRLESYTRQPGLHNWQIHAQELSDIRDLVNSKGKALERLKELRASALPWQQRSIDHIHPILKNLAEETTGAIQHINENRQYLFAPQYRETVGNIYVHADELRDMIALKLDFAEAHAKLVELEAKGTK